jgi:hypothetical protein
VIVTEETASDPCLTAMSIPGIGRIAGGGVTECHLQ